MEVREISNPPSGGKEVWESFLFRRKEKTFLQSWNWGEFQKRMGNKIWRLGIYDGKELVGTALVSKVIAKRGTFLLIQHGPNIISNSQFLISKQILKVLLEELKKIGKEEGADFIRMNPLWLARRSFDGGGENNEEIFKQLGFRKAQMHANAYEATLKLDIEPSEKELISQMRKTTRYLIRQALRNPDFEITKSSEIEDAEVYDKLNRQVAKRQQFVPFSFEFVRNEFDVFAKDNQALLFFGKYKGEIIASALIIFWSGGGFYHHAALDPKFHNFPVSYLLQWEAIKEAKKRGSKFYDFWGYVDPKTQPGHPWAGPTLFKMGFGGKPYFYLKTQDFPLSKKYWLTFIFEKLRKIKRGL